MVSRIFASWNQIGGWLLTLERLRRRVSQRQLRMLEAGKGGVSFCSMFEYLPSTQRLLDLLMHREWGKPRDLKEVRDPDPVDAALSEWENEVLSQLPDDQYRRGIWPSTPDLLKALREALEDQRGNYAGERLAFALAHCGSQEPKIVSSLNPWDALVFHWRDAGYSAERLLARFESAGAAGRPSAADVKKLNEWLAAPITSLDPYSSGYPGRILLGDRVFSESLYDNGGSPAYGTLFSGIAEHAVPPLAVSYVSQASDATTSDLTKEAHAEFGEAIPAELRNVPVLRINPGDWKVTYRLNGVADALRVRGDSTWLNDVGLIAEVNALLGRLGREDRVIKFGRTRGDSSSFRGDYLVTDPRSFVPLCRELGIPLALPT